MATSIIKFKSKTDIEQEQKNAKLARDILNTLEGKTLKAENDESELPQKNSPIITNKKELESFVAADFYTLIEFYGATTDISRLELDRIFDSVYGFLKSHQIDDEYYTLLNTCCMSAILYALEEDSNIISLDDIAHGIAMLSMPECIIEFAGIKQAILKEINEIKRGRKNYKLNKTKKGKIIEFKPRGDN